MSSTTPAPIGPSSSGGLPNRFSLTIDGTIDLGFWTTATGLGASGEPFTYQPGQAPAPVSAADAAAGSDIVLTRAACADSAKVQAWIKSCSTSASPRTWTGLISLVDSADLTTTTLTWHLVNLAPVKWGIAKAAVGTGQPAVELETLTLSHEGFPGS